MYLISWMIDIATYWFYNTFKSKNIYRKVAKSSNSSKPNNFISYKANRKKPEWVVEKVIYLKAMMPS